MKENVANQINWNWCASGTYCLWIVGSPYYKQSKRLMRLSHSYKLKHLACIAWNITSTANALPNITHIPSNKCNKKTMNKNINTNYIIRWAEKRTEHVTNQPQYIGFSLISSTLWMKEPYTTIWMHSNGSHDWQLLKWGQLDTKFKSKQHKYNTNINYLKQFIWRNSNLNNSLK